MFASHQALTIIHERPIARPRPWSRIACLHSPRSGPRSSAASARARAWKGKGEWGDSRHSAAAETKRRSRRLRTEISPTLPAQVCQHAQVAPFQGAAVAECAVHNAPWATHRGAALPPPAPRTAAVQGLRAALEWTFVGSTNCRCPSQRLCVCFITIGVTPIPLQYTAGCARLFCQNSDCGK